MELLKHEIESCCYYSYSRIGSGLGDSLPNLVQLVLTYNNLEELVSLFIVTILYDVIARAN